MLYTLYGGLNKRVKYSLTEDVYMIAQTQLKKPSNWQDFEKLCKLLWGEIWICEDTIKRHGRQGQNQYGVDVFSYVEKYSGYCGIQCKGKDDYTNAQLTEAEIDNEITKALDFEPNLKLLVFATTANKDAKIEGYIRKKDIENRAKGLFAIDIASWEDIVEQLERYRTTYNWYVNNCQFKDTTDVLVTFHGKDEITIYPEYVKTIKHYEYRKLTEIEQDVMRLSLGNLEVPYIGIPRFSFNPPKKIDKRWCKLRIRIENTGKTVIRTPKLIVSFRPEDIVEIDDNFYYFNAFGIDEAAKAQINASRDAKREVYQTYKNQLEYRPKNSVFVQKDCRDFYMSVIPVDGIKKFSLIWKFLCEDYQKKGVLTIYVEPQIEEHIKTIEVHDESELKPDEANLAPKVVEV